MECESYEPCEKCKIVKTYSCVEIEKEKYIYENPNYNFTCILIPFLVCIIDLICKNQTSYYCTILAKKYNIDLTIKQILLLLQIACYNYNNDSNNNIIKFTKICKFKIRMEHQYEIIKDPIFIEYFFHKIKIKPEFEKFISKKKLILIILDLLTIDFNQRSLTNVKLLL
jgi:hypothetical protein